MADNTDLINQLAQWAQNGGGKSPNGSSSTDIQGNLNQNMSPQITADASKSIDFGKLLQSLVGNNSSASTIDQNDADAEKVHQELMANVAKKTLTNNLQQHADNLMATNPDALKILSSAIVAHQANQNTQDNTNVTSGSNNSSLTPTQKQALNIISPATTSLGKLFESAGFGTKTKEKQLANLSTAQGIMGETPVQPSDIAKMDRETYGKTVSGYSDSLGKAVDQLKTLKEQYTALDNTRSPIDMAYSRPSQMQLPLLEQMKAVAGQVLDYHANLRKVLQNSPKSLSKAGNFKVTKVSD